MTPDPDSLDLCLNCLHPLTEHNQHGWCCARDNLGNYCACEATP